MKICFLGAGNMAEAICRGLISSGATRPRDICATDVRRQRLALIRRIGAKTLDNNIEAVRRSDVVVLAVKPKDVRALLQEIAPAFTRGKLCVSIAAGIPTGAIEKILPKGAPVVRAMPNMPALVRQGASVICRGRFAKPEHARTARKILESVGIVTELPERAMDAVTAVSGSGPAYVFHLAEMMESAAARLKLPKKEAKELIGQTILGAAGLIICDPRSPQELRAAVTSKGGTTEAAFKVLARRKFEKVFLDALKAAANRSRQLSR